MFEDTPSTILTNLDTSVSPNTTGLIGDLSYLETNTNTLLLSGSETELNLTPLLNETEIETTDQNLSQNTDFLTGLSVSDQEIISLNGLSPGDYRLKVHGYQGDTNSDYDLTLNTPIDSGANSLNTGENNTPPTDTGENPLPISEQEKLTDIVDSLSSFRSVFTEVKNTIEDNLLFVQEIALLSQRIDSQTAITFLNELTNLIDQAQTTLNNAANLDLDLILEEISTTIDDFGGVTLAIDGNMITSDLISTVELNSDSEIIFNFDFSKSFNISETIGNSETFDLGTSAIEGTVTGTAQGTNTLGFNISFGIDSNGNTFIIEGGLLDYNLNLGANLTGEIDIVGLINGGLAGEGLLTADAELLIDDGDNILNERLYLGNENFTTIIDPEGISLTGSIEFEEMTITGNLPSLSNTLNLAISASGYWDFMTGETELVFEEDALLDGLVNAVDLGINFLESQSLKLAKFTEDIPILGDNLASGLSSIIEQGFDINAPTEGTRAYLESLGIVVEKVITPEQFFSGNYLNEDVLLLRYNTSIRDSFGLDNISETLNLDPATFTLNGELNATPTIGLDVVFGLDLINGPFIIEGASLDAQLPVLLNLTGTAEIGDILEAQVSIENGNLNPQAKFIFSDFDAITDERFYLLGNNQLSLDALLSNEQAIELTGELGLTAGLTVNNPLNNLNIPILNKIIPDDFDFTWNAALTYDLATGASSYSVQEDEKIDAIFQLLQGNEQGIINLFLGDLIEANPIPQEIREFLTLDIPLLNQNLLEIIGVPASAEILINPDKFLGQNTSQINNNDDQSLIDLNLDLISASSIINLLNGNDANLISLDVEQSFMAPTEEITIFAAPVFSAFGIVNVVADVAITPEASLNIDTTIGLDTDGFYVLEGGSIAPSGRTVGDNLFSLNPELTASLTGTVLLTALPTVDLAGYVSLIGEAGIRLDDSPFIDDPLTDSNPKVRLSGLTNPDNLHVNFGIDLGFGLTSTLFPIGNFGFPLIKDGEVEEVVELYNYEAGSLADISSDIQGFIDTTEREGALTLLAIGLLTGSPILTTAASALLADDAVALADEAFSALVDGLNDAGASISDTAKLIGDAFSKYGGNLGLDQVTQIADFLYDKYSDISDVAGAIYQYITDDLGDIAKGLYDGITNDLGDIARGLYNGVTHSLDNIAKALYDGIVQDLDRIAQVILDEFGSGFIFQLGNLITQYLPDGRKIEELFNEAGDLLEKTFWNAAGVLTESIEWLSDGSQIKNLYENGVNNLRYVWNSAGKLAEKIEWLSDGSQIKNLYENGVNNLRYVWNSAGKLAEKIEWLSDGSQIKNLYENGVNNLRYVWNSAGKLAEKIEWLSDGSQIKNLYENGVNNLRYVWNSAGKLAEKIEWLSDGSQIKNLYENGVNNLRYVWNSAGKLAEKIEWLSDGSQIKNLYENGVNNLRYVWNSAGKLAEKIEWLSDGSQIKNLYENGVNNLRYVWNSAGKLAEKIEWLSDGSQIKNLYENGVNNLRYVWNSAGKLAEKIEWLSDGSQIKNLYENGVNNLRYVWNSAGKLAEKIEWLSDGSQIKNLYENGVNNLRYVWNSAGKLAEKIEWLSDGSQIKNLYENGVNNLRYVWNSAGKLAEKIEWLSDGSQIKNLYKNGVNNLRYVWNSAGKLAEKIEWLSDGSQIKNLYENGVNNLRYVWNSAGKLAEKIEWLSDGSQIKNLYENGVNNLRYVWNSAGSLTKKVEWIGNTTKIWQYAGGTVQNFWEYTDDTLTKYYDVARGWWDSVNKWSDKATDWWNSLF
ncbi:hypothetical protein [Crocosphaera chwakensis]|uniref:Uncharacterized protein n=1 Tax=Crocosphaera chwakensis CCY0110 TaxID=391612 RepID=A3IXR4_9CHRO|nr:hypothetical protein [Crocosphaera chwakensis]EAZ88717.1 hypothetical protein CY0110_01120 [Crocosphaera chwakensis CCY0110]